LIALDEQTNRVVRSFVRALILTLTVFRHPSDVKNSIQNAAGTASLNRPLAKAKCE